jgi:hypothetical protein
MQRLHYLRDDRPIGDHLTFFPGRLNVDRLRENNRRIQQQQEKHNSI